MSIHYPYFKHGKKIQIILINCYVYIPINAAPVHEGNGSNLLS